MGTLAWEVTLSKISCSLRWLKKFFHLKVTHCEEEGKYFHCQIIFMEGVSIPLNECLYMHKDFATCICNKRQDHANAYKHQAHALRLDHNVTFIYIKAWPCMIILSPQIVVWDTVMLYCALGNLFIIESAFCINNHTNIIRSPYLLMYEMELSV